MNDANLFLVTKYIFHGLHVKIKKNDDSTKSLSILTIFHKLLKSIFSFKIYFPFWKRAEHLFYAGTNNQKLVLEKIYDKIKESYLIYYHGNDVSIKNSKAKKYPFWIVYLFGVLTYPFSKSIRILFENRLSTDNSNINFNYEISLLLGFYYVNYFILIINKPKYIWLSNDHTYNNVSFIYAAKKLKIKTVYIQHASVSKFFPPLYFDFAFLDGEIAYNIYKDIGIIGTKVMLTGNPKLDGYINKFSPVNKLSKIIVCINPLDNIIDFENLIDSILYLGIKVKLRKHPYLTEVLRNENKVEFSKEDIFMDALDGVGLLIAGDSNVHLEATISNIPCMYLSTSLYYDYYGFVKNGLVIWAGKNIDMCIEEICNFTPVTNIYERAKPYCFSIGTEFQNKSALKILSNITNVN